VNTFLRSRPRKDCRRERRKGKNKCTVEEMELDVVVAGLVVDAETKTLVAAQEVVLAMVEAAAGETVVTEKVKI